jgi:hypothetical protein
MWNIVGNTEHMLRKRHLMCGTHLGQETRRHGRERRHADGSRGQGMDWPPGDIHGYHGLDRHRMACSEETPQGEHWLPLRLGEGVAWQV